MSDDEFIGQPSKTSEVNDIRPEVRAALKSEDARQKAILAENGGSDKNLRPTIREGGTGEKLGRKKIGYSKRIDIERYEEIYLPLGKKLLVVNDLDGELHFWADQGAEPVPAQASANRRQIEGWLDQAANQWVTGHAGVDDKGNAYRWHLLMIDADIYDEIKLAPQRQRQEEIRQTMHRGKAQGPDSNQGISTYAPNTVDDRPEHRGFNEIAPQVPNVRKIAGIDE